MDLSAGPSGQVWAATTGGIRYFNGQRWHTWTRLDGLPSHEAMGISWTKGGTQAWFPTATAKLQSNNKWSVGPKAEIPKTVHPVKWQGKTVTATLTGLEVNGRALPLPRDSTGSHVTGMLPWGKGLLVAMHGDGFWVWNGKQWQRPVALKALPAGAREITTIAQLDARSPLWVGTRRQGVFRYLQNRWSQHLQANEPFNHNIQYLETYRGELLASTLEDGMVRQVDSKWKHTSVPQLSTGAVRQIEVLNDALWVRHGDGYVDKWDGTKWSKNVFPQLPRRQTLAMDSDGVILVLGQWGGWSEWDGKKLVNRFEIAQLKNIPIIGVHVGKQYLWLLTQSRGIVRWDRKNETATVFDESHGLPDDWITAFCEVGDNFYAGTFVGGLARYVDGKWLPYPELKGQNVTALEPDGADGVWVATRSGVWQVNQEKIEKLDLPWLDTEVQALKAAPGGLWIGARTSLNFHAFPKSKS